jgi:serine/threonine protein kinase
LTPERWAQIRQIFDGALERPDQDRAAFLRVVCARDDDLRREVEALLASHGTSGSFLNQPAIELDRTFLQNLASTGGYGPGGTGFPYPGHTGETGEYATGYRAGPYQLQKRIGRGGMGSVWLATRFDSDFTKSFAVKLVKPGMDSQEILRRFRLEREVLSGLDHPNIARLIDGGSTPDGLPYLVMEYVEGTRIDQFCESRKISITDRLKLFRQVCSAVQYAHQHLVIHRDIKTANILVTAEGAPKLLDFGIAKLMHNEFSTLAASETRPEMRPMTLDYASPEQVRGDQITTATDIYSLGVLLYKLLTGKTPYGPEARSQPALQHAICEVEPLKPSAVILTDTKAVIPAATHAIEVGQETHSKARRRLKKKLKGDLDMILLMALRKEPHRRYVSAEQFSDDVGRYLDGRPVIARRDTLGYRAGKFVRRNPTGVAAGVLAAVALVAATGVSAYYAQQAGQQRTRAEARFQSERAEDLRQERELVETYFRLAQIQDSSLKDSQAALATFRLALAEARTLATIYPEQADGRRSLAQAAMKVGDLVPAEAPERYSEAVGLLEALAHAQPQDAGLQRDVLSANHGLGLAQYRSGNLLAALATFSRALQLAEAGAGGADDKHALAACNFAIGEVLLRNGETDAAVGKLRKAVELYSQFAGTTAPLRDNTPAGYERALRQIAASAQSDRRVEMEADLTPFLK